MKFKKPKGINKSKIKDLEAGTKSHFFSLLTPQENFLDLRKMMKLILMRRL